MKLSKELKAGIIVVVALIAFFVLFQFTKGKRIFSSENIYYVKYNDVEGLTKSSPVSINGLKVGKVEEITPVISKDGHIHFVVEMSVNQGFTFAKSSTVEIFAPGLMQDKALKIDLAFKGPQAIDGDTLQGEVKPSAMAKITDQIGPVAEKLTSVLTRVDTLTKNTNKILDEQNRREIKALLANLNATALAFKQTAAQATTFLASNQERMNHVLDNANKTMVAANQAVTRYGEVAKGIDPQKLDSAITKLASASENLNKILTEINSGNGSLGKLVNDDELYNNLNSSVNSLNELLKDFKENPNRYVNFSVFGKSAK